MAVSRVLTLTVALALAAPAITAAQSPWTSRPAPVQSQFGYREGFFRGEQAGLEDGRRGDQFRFTDESDYQRGDIGYRPSYGNRDAFRLDFRYGFEAGYRQGYDRVRGSYGRDGSFGRDGSVGRNGTWNGRAVPRFDLAADTGFNDGYRAGLDDGRNRRRSDPRLERDYRNGDAGYERWYGPREAYQLNYRQAFVEGYERGYLESVRYR